MNDCRYLALYTADRTAASPSSSDCTLHFSPSLDTRGRKLRLKCAVIPRTMYNVTNYNNTFSIDYGGGPVTCTLTPGFYNATDLAAHLQTRMTATGHAWTVTFVSISGKLAFTPSVNAKIIVSTLPESSDIWKVMGLTDVGNRVAADSPIIVGLSTWSPASIVQVYFPPLLAFRFKLRQDPCYDYFIAGRDQVAVSLLLPTHFPYGTVMMFNEGQFDMEIVPSSHSITDLSIRVFDERGNLVDFNGGELQFIFEWLKQ